ncbi:hypothetical protein Cni_G25581 [Canna indica]|uniref:Uncharacterized protein n=1 Tax=Canna indica TaxID=4628 RepID=A0AAQ3L1E4_9LILI|nr:hypothetical protein Cni_G25581 [Canna indica]
MVLPTHAKVHEGDMKFEEKMESRVRSNLAALLQVPHIGVQDSYLGLPLMVGRSKRAAYEYIKERVTKKLHHWKRSLLSADGNVLIKAVGTAIPLYLLGCFKLLETLLDEI